MVKPMPICFKLLRHWVCFARSLALASAGNNIAARIAMMAITTRSAIRVKPFDFSPSMFLMIFQTHKPQRRDGLPEESGSPLARVYWDRMKNCCGTAGLMMLLVKFRLPLPSKLFVSKGVHWINGCV